MSFSNVSADLVWEIVRPSNSFLVKRKINGGVQFSRDPYNLTNAHSRKHAGFVNEKAVGVLANEKGGVTVISKKIGAANKPAKGVVSVTHGGNKTNRKTFKSIASRVAKSGYRADLRETAIARASAIRRSQRPPKPEAEKKLRGNAAKKAAEAASE